MTNDKPSSKDVENLVDRLVTKYETDEFRLWYFSLAYRLGLKTMEELEIKADKGNTPGRLFSYLAKEKLGELENE